MLTFKKCFSEEKGLPFYLLQKIKKHQSEDIDLQKTQVLNLSLKQKWFQPSNHAKESNAYIVMLRFDHGLTYLDSVRSRPTWKMIIFNEANSQTAIDNAQKTDPAPCKFVGFGSETVTAMMQVVYYNASTG